MRARAGLRLSLFLLLMAAVGWFFASQVRTHWAQLASFQITLHWPWIGAGLVLVVIHYLAATAAWRMALQAGTTGSLSYVECIGLSNISQLTKYLPGKIWSYALQMHLLAPHGISKTRVLSTNLLMLLSLMASAAVIGCGYLMSANVLLPPDWSKALFAAVAAAYLSVVFGGTRTINSLISLVNRLLRRSIGSIEIPFGDVLRIHVLNFGANIVYAMAGCLVALGVGASFDISLAGPVGSATLLSDAAGLLAVVVPGGIGVREGVMYAMLKPFIGIQTCFALLIAFRLVTMAGDLLLGGSAMGLLYFFVKSRPRLLAHQDGKNA